MKDPDAMYPSLFSEDSTTSTKEKVKIINKTKGVLRATRKCANHQRQDADAGAALHIETRTHASSARTPADTLHAEPTDVESGHQDISAHASIDQETHLDVPKQTVLPTPAPATSQQPSSSLPSTITGKLYWMAGALFGTLEGCSKLLI
ncbi:g4299 [Coccomyxa viridis]|uniref:G4299 protein n=1 Tax=Coccomyxa viridis TaxID=1274662 RepID=A0ABP1FPZ9_9CHLO